MYGALDICRQNNINCFGIGDEAKNKSELSYMVENLCSFQHYPEWRRDCNRVQQRRRERVRAFVNVKPRPLREEASVFRAILYSPPIDSIEPTESSFLRK